MSTGSSGHVSAFESIRQTDEDGYEYWSARDLANVLGYRTNYRNFTQALQRAKDICLLLRQDVTFHFTARTTTAQIGKGAEREIIDCRLTWFSLHLVLLCSDLKKPEVVRALAAIAFLLLGTESEHHAAAQARPIPELGEIAITKEQKTISQIVRAFKHLRSIPHYRVAPYFVDLYFPDYRIVVECDEMGHRDYSPTAESARQGHIESALHCRFVRYNPDAADFNIGDVIHQIMLLVYAKGSPCS